LRQQSFKVIQTWAKCLFIGLCYLGWPKDQGHCWTYVKGI